MTTDVNGYMPLAIALEQQRRDRIVERAADTLMYAYLGAVSALCLVSMFRRRRDH